MPAAPSATVGTWKAGPGSSCLSLRWLLASSLAAWHGVPLPSHLTSLTPICRLPEPPPMKLISQLFLLPGAHTCTLSAPAYHLLWQITRPLFSSTSCLDVRTYQFYTHPNTCLNHLVISMPRSYRRHPHTFSCLAFVFAVVRCCIFNSSGSLL